MNKAAAWMSILVFGASVSLLCADDLPTKLSFDRYKGMLDNSPFAVATAVMAPAATPAPCKDLYIANAAHSPDGDMVTLASSADKEFKKYLTAREAVDGYAIAGIEWSDKVGETRVTISKDGKFCTLTFNQAVLSQTLPTKPVPPAPGIVPSVQQPPFQKPAQGGLFNAAAPNPAVPLPTPHVRGTIQRYPQPPQKKPMVTPSSNAEE